MKAKNIFKTLAFAMLMPTMLLTTSCSSDDFASDGKTATTETVANKGYALPVTVSATRQGDGTRATFDGSKLNFSAGDKLFVEGTDYGEVGRFAGLLDYDASEGKFSGTIYTQNEYSGPADALFTAGFVKATLLPAGYKSYGYLYIDTHDVYNDEAARNNTYTLATSKADGVAQFSYEEATEYNDGFALAPQNAILNFTITGLAASTNVNVSLTSSMAYNITGTVTTDTEGKATFAAGVRGGQNLQDFTLTVAGNPITLVSSSKTLTAGKIYNISRSVAPAPAYTLLSAATAEDIGKVVCAAGHLHDAKTDVPAGCTAVGILGKVTETGHGLILALQDAMSQTWNTINSWISVTKYAGTTLMVLPDDDALGDNLTSFEKLGDTFVSDWAVAQKSDYEAIFTNLGSMKSDTYGTTYDDNVNAYITTGVGGTELSSGYFSATEHDIMPGFAAWAFTSDYWQSQMQTVSYSVRPVLGF